MQIKDIKGKGTVSILECLNKAKELQPKLNAVVSFANVEENIEKIKNYTDGALFQVPIFLKDNVSTKGLRTTASSRILDNYVPIFNATIVDKLEQAGAVVVGKTSMDELGMGGTNLNAYTGKVNNPYDLNRITGGSSGGSAAVVASGLTPLAIGTDTGDSVRKPAAYCGVVGLKPTYGRISRYGIIPYASSLDHVGLFTTSVNDAAIALEVLSGRDDKDMTSSNREVEAYASKISDDINGKRIGVIKNVYDAIQDTQIISQFDETIKKLKDAGAIVEFISFKETTMNALLPTYYVISNAEATANHSNLDGIRFGMREEGNNLEEIMINSRTKGFSSEVRKRFVIGSYSLFTDNQEKIFRKAQKVRRVIVNELDEILSDYDGLIAPAAGTIAPHENESIGDKLGATYLVAENHMLLANFSGYPSITVPSGKVDGLPIGINILSKAFDEINMFDIAKAIETVCETEGNCTEVKA